MSLTPEQLAHRAGAEGATVERFASLGLLEAEAGGGFPDDQIERLKFLEAMQASGTDMVALADYVRSGKLSLRFADAIFPDPVGLDDRTHAELFDELGLDPEQARRFQVMMGLPAFELEARVREDDAELYSILTTALEVVPVDSLMRATLLFAEVAEKLASFGQVLFRETLIPGLKEAEANPNEWLPLSSEIGRQLQPIGFRFQQITHRRAIEVVTYQNMIEQLEMILEQAGMVGPRAVDPPAMLFLDLSGFTQLTESAGDRVAAESASALAGLARTAATANRGTTVKALGDGVMLHFPRPPDAVAAGLDLVGSVPDIGLPPAHVGIASGPVVPRDGDYFGRTVNLAARISDHAGPSEVLVTEEVATVSAEHGRFEPVGPAQLKGVANPVELFRASSLE